MQCRHCGEFCEPTFEGLQRWCRGCGRLYWMNPNDTVRGEHVPKFLGQLPVLEAKVNSLEADVAAATAGAGEAW